MRAKRLRRSAPRMDTRTEPNRASEARPTPIPPELQAKMVAAFERARAERLAVQLPEDGAHSASDPRTRSNTAAFLVLERERRVVAARLSRHYLRRRDRYRDLILATKLIHVEYEHLAGRAIESADSRSPSNGDGGGGERPADWARPWGSGPLIEMDTALSFYEDQRDQLGRRLPVLSRNSAAAAAAGHRDRILSRFEMAKEWAARAGAASRLRRSSRGPGCGRALGSPAAPRPSPARAPPSGSGRSWSGPAAMGPPASQATRRLSSQACPTPWWPWGDGSRLVAEATGRRLRSPTEATWPRTRPRRARRRYRPRAPEPVLEPAPAPRPGARRRPRSCAPGARTPARPEASAGTRLPPASPGRHPAASGRSGG